MNRFLTLLLAFVCFASHAAERRLIGPGSYSQIRRVQAANQTPYLILTNSTDRIGMYIRGTGNLSIDWGNGSNTVLALQNVTNYALSNMYGSSAMRTITMRGNITRIDSQGAAAYGGAAATSFGGDISTLKSLTFLYCYGSNTLGGSVTGLTGLTTLSVTGTNTLKGDISRLPLTYLSCYGYNTLNGNISGLTNLTYFNAQGSNTLTGSISQLSAVTFFVCTGSNSISGSLSAITNTSYVWLTGNNTVTGWEQCASNAPTMSMMYHGGLTLLTQSQVDGVLNGFWMNRDVAKARASERTIHLAVVNDATPSSAGLTVKTNLAAYKSPNNTGPMFWTVTTK